MILCEWKENEEDRLLIQATDIYRRFDACKCPLSLL